MPDPQWRLYVLVDGEPVEEADYVRWARWFETADRLLRSDKFEGVEVATFFVGIETACRGDPLLWETLIVGGPRAGQGERYASAAAALFGHGQWVARVREVNDA